MKALIVEDHPPAARLLAETIRISGIEPEICSSAEEAIVLLSGRGVSAFDFYFLDLQLPGVNGIALCEWIRTEPGGGDPHITVATGADHTESLADAFEAGADEYVEKPFTPRALALRLAVAREQREARRERHRKNRELSREKDFVTAMIHTAAACIVAVDRDGRIVEMNQATIDITGRAVSDLKGCLFAGVATAGDTEAGKALAGKLQSLADGDAETVQFESTLTDPGRDCRHFAWLCRRAEDPSAPGPGYRSGAWIVCVGTDITERRRKETRLAFLAERDPLTRLYNRSRLEPAVRRAIHGLRNRARPAAVMCLDLDRFKTVNDCAGHAAGDEVLQVVARTLSEITRPTDTVIRLGGDEFVLVLPDSPEDRISAVAERIRGEIDALRFEFGGRIYRVTASIGVAMLTPATSVSEALDRADSACYASKQAGRNRSHVAPAAMVPSSRGFRGINHRKPRLLPDSHRSEPAPLALAS